MNERRNDLEIMNWIPQIALQIQTRIDLLFTMSENTQAHVCEDSACEVMFRGRCSLVRQPARLRSLELRRARFAFRPGGCATRSRKAKRGGARRDRTDDLMLAKHALSQLSYGPNF